MLNGDMFPQECGRKRPKSVLEGKALILDEAKMSNTSLCDLHALLERAISMF